jgi:hypothetical protein
MLIWLGKQYLHQSDHLKLSGDEDSPININITQDLSKLSDEELRQLDGITAKLESKEGIGKEAPS